jgi:hypothetical protein
MTSAFAAFSTSISGLVAAAAPSLVAIRSGPGLAVTGLLVEPATIITTDQALPAQDHYTVVMPHGDIIGASPGVRARALASLRLTTPVAGKPLAIGAAQIGGLVLVLAADHAAAPMVRLTLVHRMIQAGGEPVAELELAPQQVDPGGVVLDAHGRVLGLLRLGPVGQAIVQPLPGPTAVPVSSGRGWLGVSLQPTTVPDAVADRVGQQTGRMVVSLTAGGPAELGGLRLGDVLLTVNDVGLSGPHALRDALKAETIGSTITVGVLRDGGLMSIHLVVATRPH